MSVQIVAATGFSLPTIPLGVYVGAFPFSEKVTLDFKSWVRELANYCFALSEYSDHIVDHIRMSQTTYKCLKAFLDEDGEKNLWAATIELDPKIPFGMVEFVPQKSTHPRTLETQVLPTGLKTIKKGDQKECVSPRLSRKKSKKRKIN